MSDIREPQGIILNRNPARVTVRIHADGRVLFEGSAALEYSDAIYDCYQGGDLELSPSGAP